MMLLPIGLAAVVIAVALLLLRRRQQMAVAEGRRRRAAYRTWRWEHFVWRKRHKRLPDLRDSRANVDIWRH